MKINLQKQKGVGLMEVLVAMLIIAIAILGYAALQIRATTATEESLKRSDALILLNGLAEKIRLNPTGNYKAAIPNNLPNCDSGCNANQQAQYDLKEYNDLADNKQISLGVIDCLNTSSNQTRLCLLAAWNETDAVADTSTASTPATETECLQKNGAYVRGSNCLMLEAY